MTENTMTHQHTYRSFVENAIAVILLVGAVVLWPLNKIVSLVLIITVVYIVVTFSSRLILSNSSLFPASNIEHDFTDLRAFRLASPDYRRAQPYKPTRVSISLSSIYDADTDSLSQPSNNATTEVPLPPSIVIDDEDVSDEEFYAIGIRTIKDLADTSPEDLVRSLDIDDSEAEDLVFRANIVYYGANITSLMDLAMLTPKEIVLKIKNGPWRDLYSSETDLSYLEELAEQWIDIAKIIMTRSLSDFFRGRKNL